MKTEITRSKSFLLRICHCFLSIFIVFFLLPSSAKAIQFASNPASATYAQVWDYTPTDNGLYTFETEIQNPTGDTILYVQGGNVSAFNDDCHMDLNNVCPTVGQNSLRRSKVTVTLEQGVTYKIIVVAFVTFGDASSRIRFSGSANVKATNHQIRVETIWGWYFAYTYLASNMAFGGDMIDVRDSNPDLHLYASTSGKFKEIQAWYPIMLLGVKCDRSPNGLSTGFTGVGLHSALSTVGSCGIYVASKGFESLLYTYGDEYVGVNLMLNDAFNPNSDEDQDYLGVRLEQELGTCDRANQILLERPNNPPNLLCSDTMTNPSGATVRRVHNFQDSDLDGIPDLNEVYGMMIYVNGTNQLLHLPSLGASPSRKDIFLELDEFNGGNPLSGWENVIRSLHNTLKDAPSVEVLNTLPQISGIQVHADLGISPQTTEDQELVLFGDWGGHNIFSSLNPLPPGHPAAGQQPYNIVEQIGRENMQQVRQGIFRYVYAFRDPNRATGCELAAPVASWHMRLNYGFNETDATVCQRALIRGVGHSMGLETYGHVRWGAAEGNPHYRSIMSPTAPQVGTFSTVPPSHQVTGNAPHFQTLNPRSVLVSDPLGTSINHDFLSQSPYLIPMAIFSSGPPFFQIQWGYNNITTPTAELFYPVTLSTNSKDFALQNKQEIQEMNGEVTAPALVFVEKKSDLALIATERLDSRIYLFYVSQEGGVSKVFYRFAKTNVSIVKDPVTTTPPTRPRTNQVSCPGGDKLAHMGNDLTLNPANICTSWSSAIAVPGTDGAKSVSAVFIREIGTDVIEQFLIAYVAQNNTLMSRRSSSVNFTNATQNGLGAGHILWDSTPGGWKSVSANVVGEPHILLRGSFQRPPSGYPQQANYQDALLPEGVELFFRKSDLVFRQLSLLRNTPADWTWTSSGGYVVTDQATNQPLSGSLDAAPLWWWSETTNGQELCAVFPGLAGSDGGSLVRFYCKDGLTWVNRTQQAFGTETFPIFTTIKPAIVVRYARHGDINDRGTRDILSDYGGSLWLVTMPPNVSKVKLYISKKYEIKPSLMQAPIFENVIEPYNFFDTGTSGAKSISLLDHPQLINARAAVILPNASSNQLVFLPFADGVYDVTFTTDSDFKVMGRGLCLGTLRGHTDQQVSSSPEAQCGTIFQNPWGY